MKKILYLLAACFPLFFFTTCADFLEEENHSKMTPESFNTPQGFELGLNGVYGGMRTFYGPISSIHMLTVTGTDEFYSRSSGDIYNFGNYTTNYKPNSGYIYDYWRHSYTLINTCNGLVHFGEEMTDISEAKKITMLAEARFFRALLYFRLVQFFGDVTLNRTYNEGIVKEAKRDPIADVYDFVIEDLLFCTTPGHLPVGPKDTDPGRVTQALARHLLAKVYLTRGWSSAAQPTDFQDAYDIATALIKDGDLTGVTLMPKYADIHKPGNENNQEILYNVQMTDDPIYGVPERDANINHLSHVFVAGYFNFNGSGNVQQIEDGRVYARYHGTTWLYNEAFGDIDKDSRYYGTFQSEWTAPVDFQNKVQEFYVGDNKYSAIRSGTKGNLAGYLPGKNIAKEEIEATNYYILTPENYTDPSFPTMKKFVDPNRTSLSFDSRRSIIVYRLAETYLIAAEAAFKLGNNSTTDGAAYYINELRKRAASKEEYIDDLMITAEDITIDYILDERTRELCGEQLRWLDLVRTQKLVERVRKYGFFTTKWTNHTLPKDNIQDFHILRPIPQKQIESVIVGDPYPQQPNGWDKM
ncbi:RagB/SusD family nutrient uptake outer membrane protein [Proteiniphilum sp.]|uniref:RagB/SusD family nutrient uptake outer membrane protein n=1 Tax=Proteiniphilum sp. TaxID=1926877 RepID=UPI00332907EC